jgi:uncharacterized protein YecT (DUF1311 family)
MALCLAGLLAASANAYSQSRTAAGEIACKQASTQAELNGCAYEDFLVAQAEMAKQLKPLLDAFSVEQRAGLRRVQRAWVNFRTEACSFESRQAGSGSSQPMLQWQCATRMTRERIVALVRMANCPEGDLACVRAPVAGKPGR